VKKLLYMFLMLMILAGCRQELPVSTTASGAPTLSTAQTTEKTAGSTVPTTEPAPETEPTTLPEPQDTEFVRVTDWIPNAREALAYATDGNFTGKVIYDFTEAWLRWGTVKKLSQVCGELEEMGLGLILWDCFRPVSAQEKLWEACPDANYVSPPGTGKQSHCRGNTVDISLYDLTTGEPLPMPTDFDDFSGKADRDYGDCPREAAENALLLEGLMEKYGFVPYFKEWWHFSDGEDYPIAEGFVPGR